MKTSNKLLIITACLLILIPMVTVIYVSKANYKSKDGLKEFEQSQLSLDIPTEGFSSVAFSKAFNTITISNGGLIILRLIKNEKFGVKIPSVLRDSARIELNGKGELEIHFLKNKPNRHWYSTVLMIYAPDFSKLNIQKSDEVNIVGNLQAFHINANHVGTIRFGEAAKINDLKIEADSIMEITVETAKIKNMDATFNSGTFNSVDVAYSRLALHASGEAGVGLVHTDPDKPSIKHLFLHTNGKNSISFTNIKIDTLLGKLSEQTDVSMPVTYVKQLLK